jgi:glycosyltransferase involved in cell wall biosynthesis
MKIVILASYAPSLVNFRGALIRRLLDGGWDVVLVAPDIQVEMFHSAPFNLSEVTIFTVPMQRTGTNPVKDLLYILALYRLLKKLKAQAMLAYTVKPVVYGLIAAQLAGIRHRYALITGLGYAFTEGRSELFSTLVKKLYKFSLKKSEKVMFQNPDDRDFFYSLNILPKNFPSVVVNGSGVNISEFVPVPFPKAISFLLIARFLVEKGIREYIQAARLVKSRFPEVRFLLVGWIDDNPDAITDAELRGWVDEGVIEYLGRLVDVRPAISEASVYVLPSYREGTPRTVLEAMAMGRPVITTDAPGCRETVVHGKNGYLVPVKSSLDLADAMMQFVLYPDLLASMSTESRKIAEDKYDVNKINDYMISEMVGG